MDTGEIKEILIIKDSPAMFGAVKDIFGKADFSQLVSVVKKLSE